MNVDFPSETHFNITEKQADHLALSKTLHCLFADVNSLTQRHAEEVVSVCLLVSALRCMGTEAEGD